MMAYRERFERSEAVTPLWVSNPVLSTRLSDLYVDRNGAAGAIWTPDACFSAPALRAGLSLGDQLSKLAPVREAAFQAGPLPG